MTALVVNVILISAVLVGVGAALVGHARRTRREREQRNQDRQLLLSVLTSAVSPLDAAAPLDPPREASTASSPLDTATLAALLELLEDRRLRRRGIIAGLVSSPSAMWAAGARAGQRLADQPGSVCADGEAPVVE